MDRRKFISTVGASFASVGAVGQASAKRDLDKIHKQAVRIFQETQDQEKYERYLRNHGLTVQSTTVKIPAHGGGVGTQEASESKSSVSFSLSFEKCTNSLYVDLNFDLVDKQDIIEYPPNDGLAIAWARDDYSVKAPAGVYPSPMIEERRMIEYNGAAWHYNDKEGYNNNRFSGFVSLKLTLSTKPIYGYYWHTSNSHGRDPTFRFYDSGDVDTLDGQWAWKKEIKDSPSNIC